MLSTSKSFRSAPDKKIRRTGTDGYLVVGQFLDDNGGYRIGIEYSEDRKQLSINGTVEQKISSIIGCVYCVLFFFEDIYLVTGPPYLRRGFLDLALSTVDPLYFRNLRVYLNLIRQKNRYLKDNTDIDRALIGVWDDQLVENGSYIVEKRLSFIRFINGFIEKSLHEIKELLFPFRVQYKSNVLRDKLPDDVSEIKVRFREELAKKIEKEMNLRQSICGPHRDDFIFTDDNFEIRYFGSVGEARLSSIILKQSQAAYYNEVKNVVPILLIDDILLELDLSNMEKVLHLIDKKWQRIITTTERIKLPEIFSCERVFNISNKGDITWEKVV
jgi:DNA replication and repair protein RecF